jgi:hypothetical protein
LNLQHPEQRDRQVEIQAFVDYFDVINRCLPLTLSNARAQTFGINEFQVNLNSERQFSAVCFTLQNADNSQHCCIVVSRYFASPQPANNQPSCLSSKFFFAL